MDASGVEDPRGWNNGTEPPSRVKRKRRLEEAAPDGGLSVEEGLWTGKYRERREKSRLCSVQSVGKVSDASDASDAGSAKGSFPMRQGARTVERQDKGGAWGVGGRPTAGVTDRRVQGAVRVGKEWLTTARMRRLLCSAAGHSGQGWKACESEESEEEEEGTLMHSVLEQSVPATDLSFHPPPLSAGSPLSGRQNRVLPASGAGKG